jgi:glutathione S-transferase
MIELYHAEPASNSLKVLLCLKEKGIEFVSHLMDIQAFEQHEPWYLKINPDGQVPALVHDGVVLTESTVINEYLDQVFPEFPLRPRDALECARMRIFTKYIDEYFRPALSSISWQIMIHKITERLSQEEFEAKLARIPREEKRDKWRISAAQGYSAEQMAAWRRTLAEGIGKMEAVLGNAEWLAGAHYSLADIACFAMVAHMPARFSDIMSEAASPRVMDWHRRMSARPAVQAALAMPSPVRDRR